MPFWSSTNDEETLPLRSPLATYGINDTPTPRQDPSATSSSSSQETPEHAQDISPPLATTVVQPQQRPSPASETTPEAVIATLTRRTRCLFTVLTAPILPMILMVGVALGWFILQAIRFRSSKDCRQMQAYAICSAILAVYTPFHYRHRQIPHVFIRQWDQCFHTIAVFYIYAGLTLVQACRRSSGTDFDMDAKLAQSSSFNSNGTETGVSDVTSSPSEHHGDTCTAACPELYQALTVYVWTLQGLIVCFVLPLLCLPLIYVWFIRRSGDAQTRLNELLRDQLHDDELVSSSGNVRVANVLAALRPVKLLVDPADRVWACQVSRDDDDGERTPTQVKGIAECCICMEMFDTVDGIGREDVEQQVDSTDTRVIVQAPSCGHLFHSDCITGWVGGQWNDSSTSNDESTGQRRARRTTCPLCRADLRPSGA